MGLILLSYLILLLFHQNDVMMTDAANFASFDKSDYLVSKQELSDVVPAFQEFDGEMYAGTLPIDIIDIDSPRTIEKKSSRSRGEYMFWYFQPNITSHDSITIWLNGGPGCSSFSTGLPFEISPVTTPHFPAGYPETTTKTQPLIVNEWAWTKATNLLFVEQPGGIGFSKGPTPQNETDLSIDFYNFLVNFYKTFPELQSKKLYIFGESYAGMYVPSIAHQIYIENNKKEQSHHINLYGIGIGNGWMDAKQQGDAVIDYAYWHGMIDSTGRHYLEEKWKDCLESSKHMKSPFHDFTITDECNIAGVVLEMAGAGIFPEKSPNVYDVTTWDTVSFFSHFFVLVRVCWD